jgi:putative transposase
VAEVNAQVLQEEPRRLDKTFQTFFRRVQAGATLGYPRLHGRDRYNSLAFPQVDEHGGATLAGGLHSVSKIGRIAIRLHRPLEGKPKTVMICREAEG